MKPSSDFPSPKSPCAFSSSMGTLVLCFSCPGDDLEVVGAHTVRGISPASSHAEGFRKTI